MNTFNLIAFILGFFIVLETVAAAMRIEALKKKWSAFKYFLTMISGGSGVMAWHFGGATFIHVIMLISIFCFLWTDTFYRAIGYLQTFYPKIYTWPASRFNISDRRHTDIKVSLQ